MKIISSLRKKCRLLFDGLFCRRLQSKVYCGDSCGWNISEKLIQRDPFVVSARVGNNMSFELDIVRKYGCEILLFDPSSTGIRTATKAENVSPKIKFHPKGLAGKSGAIQFSLPRDPIEGSFTVLRGDNLSESLSFDCVSLPDVLNRAGWKKAGLLKIDVEGFEYEILDTLLEENPDAFSQICVEFHHFLPEIEWSKTWNSIKKLYSKGYRLIHKTQCDYLFIHKKFL